MRTGAPPSAPLARRVGRGGGEQGTINFAQADLAHADLSGSELTAEGGEIGGITFYGC